VAGHQRCKSAVYQTFATPPRPGDEVICSAPYWTPSRGHRAGRRVNVPVTHRLAQWLTWASVEDPRAPGSPQQGASVRCPSVPTRPGGLLPLAGRQIGEGAAAHGLWGSPRIYYTWSTGRHFLLDPGPGAEVANTCVF